MSVIATYVFAAVGTFIILKILSLFMELRVSPNVEAEGLDVPEHGEEAYGQEFEFSGGMPIGESFGAREGEI